MIDETPDLEYSLFMTPKVENVTIKRWWDIWIAVLGLAAICMVAGRLLATEWTSDLEILLYLIFLAGLSGFALGYSRFSHLVAALFSTIYAIFTMGWLFGTTVEIEMTWRDRIFNELVWRLQIAMAQFNAGENIIDPILFLSIMGILFWIIGSSAAFMLVREGAVWPSILPLGLTLLIISHYDQDLARNRRFLITFLFLTFLLLGRMTFLHYRERWRQEGIHTTAETQINLSKTLVGLTAALLLTAWIIPITPPQITREPELWRTITNAWDRMSEQVSDIFVFQEAILTSTSGYFDDSMILGSGSPASEEIIFTVRAESETPEGYRHYWRARSYDYYANADWSSSIDIEDKLLYPDNFDIQYPAWEVGQISTYSFTSHVIRLVNLVTTGVPIWASPPVEAITQPLSETEEDLIALIAKPNLKSGETYQITTRINLLSADKLRNSGTDYPDWVNRYLQLPADFSPDIKALAEAITEDRDNPYTKTYDITRYLRLNMKYARTISPVPENKDPLEWFLFDEKTGFCNYYASAQVLMLRSLGIPARLAVGYAEGEYDQEANTYTVRKLNSHAWPEVYFVGYGWVAFEPTVSEPPMFLPAVSQPQDTDNELVQMEDIPFRDAPLEEEEMLTNGLPEEGLSNTDRTTDQSSLKEERNRTIWTVLAAVLITLTVTITILLNPTYFKINMTPLPVLLERNLVKREKQVPNWLRRWSTIARMSAAEKAYLQLGRSIKSLGHPLNLAETPVERALTLIKLLPNAKLHIQDIISQYHLDKFSNHSNNAVRAKNAARQLKGLVLKAKLQKIMGLGIPD
jgi:transglutaminase-like putative cysteine protease